MVSRFLRFCFRVVDQRVIDLFCGFVRNRHNVGLECKEGCCGAAIEVPGCERADAVLYECDDYDPRFKTRKSRCDKHPDYAVHQLGDGLG